MEKTVLLVDIAGVYRAQGFTSWMEKAGIPYREAAVEGLEGTHCYCDDDARKAILAALDDCGAYEMKVRFLGSGDYHYLSCLLAEGIEEPFSLVLMDHHPDNQPPALGNVLSCGGWVNDLRQRCPALQDVLTVGPQLQDIPEGWVESHRRVYVSLDKDIMLPQYAVTGWTQGTHTLEDVKRMLDKLSALEVIAVDICGECSPDACQAVNLGSNIELLNHIMKTLYV